MLIHSTFSAESVFPNCFFFSLQIHFGWPASVFTTLCLFSWQWGPCKRRFMFFLYILPFTKKSNWFSLCWVLTEQAKLEAFQIRSDLQKSERWRYGHAIAVCDVVLFCFIVKPWIYMFFICVVLILWAVVRTGARQGPTQVQQVEEGQLTDYKCLCWFLPPPFQLKSLFPETSGHGQ